MLQIIVEVLLSLIEMNKTKKNINKVAYDKPKEQ